MELSPLARKCDLVTGRSRVNNALRILVVVQRYGEEVNGGAELHARWLAESLAAEGQDVHVLTTCARDYTTWANYFEPGTSDLNGVTVHRELVDTERDLEYFNSFSARLDWANYVDHTPQDEIDWLRLQGPISAGLDKWLLVNGANFDVVVPFTYLYRTAHHVLHRLHGAIPIVMHATAHDEQEFKLPTLKKLLQHVDHFLCSTPEEGSIITRYLGESTRTTSVGIGVSPRQQVEVKTELRQLGIDDRPFILVLGRVDGSKGIFDVIDHVNTYRAKYNSDAHLVVAGQNVAQLESDRNTTFVGFVTDDQVTALLQGCSVLVQPSPAESFSLVLCEAWLEETPTLSTAQNEVLVGQTRRAVGGLTYVDGDDFAHKLDQLMHSPLAAGVRPPLAKAYVQQMFDPAIVTQRILRVLRAEVAGFKSQGN